MGFRVTKDKIGMIPEKLQALKALHVEVLTKPIFSDYHSLISKFSFLA